VCECAAGGVYCQQHATLQGETKISKRVSSFCFDKKEEQGKVKGFFSPKSGKEKRQLSIRL
jgi:hypothetical protein